MKMLVGSFVVLSLAMGTAVLGAAEDSIVGIASVIDGDTIEIHTAGAFACLAPTFQKAANSACDQPASDGAAGSNQALLWRIGSGVRRYIANRATLITIVATLLSV